jgi:CheY-like chemotaxis protein
MAMENETLDQLRHVLLAEDDDDDYLIFSLAISEISYKVLLTRAEDGQKLMAILAENTPDILFLDLYMPVKDGQQCLKEIRSDPKYDALPVIVYTSLDDIRNIEVCFREGANLFIVKPVSYPEVTLLIEKVVSIDWKKAMYYPKRSEFVVRGSPGV